MSTKISSYNSTENLKITYFLGAGASYNAIPILNKQGKSIVNVANKIISILNNENNLNNDNYKILYHDPKLLSFANDLKKFGEKAIEYGSIDIYARRLYLLNAKSELNKLKHCLSVYFDIWENIWGILNLVDASKNIFYDKIDKRYLSLLSVLLERTPSNPKLNERVKFISWNYDLQLEMAYKSFILSNSVNTMEHLNNHFKFMNISNESINDIIHLNGYRGFFEYEDKFYSNIENEKITSLEDYLLGLLDNYSQFKGGQLNYLRSIKYAWEADSEIIEKALNIMKNTDVLIIIGYSFPSFNRDIDSKLIKAFESTDYYRVVYQDPNGSNDIVNSIFSNTNKVEIQKDIPLQFHIPHEFLSPSEGKEFTLGIE